MLHHRHELDVRETQVADVVDQMLGEVDIAHAGAPRAQVHLVDRQGSRVRVALPLGLLPLPVVPLIVRVVDHRPRARRHLGPLCHGVGLVAFHIVRTADPVLVCRSGTHPGDEEFPDPRVPQEPHRMGAVVPPVEVANDRDRLGARCPHGKGGAAHPAERAVICVDVGAEDLPEALVSALVDQEAIDLADGRWEPVRVVVLVLDAIGPGGADPVVQGATRIGAHPAPDAIGLVLEFEEFPVLETHPDPLCQRSHGPDPQALALQMLTEQVMRLLVPAVGQGPARTGQCAGGSRHVSPPWSLRHAPADGRWRRAGWEPTRAGFGLRRRPRRAPCR